jgi:Fe-S-cluster containining protein
VNSLETELEHARDLSVSELADAIERIGFECTDCGACCKAAECGDASGTDESRGESVTDSETTEAHTATVFPDEVRSLQARESYDWRDVARPMPYGLADDGQRGETFEWALQTDACGDCTFYDTEESMCSVYDDRPLICRTYPFSVALGGTSQPMGEAVDSEGMVRAHECEGLGRDISRADAEDLAAALKERTVRELEEAIDVRDNYKPVEADDVVVYDSEGPKQADGTPY